MTQQNPFNTPDLQMLGITPHETPDESPTNRFSLPKHFKPSTSTTEFERSHKNRFTSADTLTGTSAALDVLSRSEGRVEFSDKNAENDKTSDVCSDEPEIIIHETEEINAEAASIIASIEPYLLEDAATPEPAPRRFATIKSILSHTHSSTIDSIKREPNASPRTP
ncbi:hypothetical protein HDU98_004886 [Podochytrium sp. JEL0797]|nr:hypothetical protein HDU98_004886 [Podochytrium sp. JEL0797]